MADTRRPFTFALTAPSPRSPVAEWIAALRRLEAAAFDELVLVDHFTGGYDNEPLVGLTAVAMATERLRLRTAVLGVDYRHPVLVHRMAAELDVVSDGRLTLGLGAGWMTSDYEAAGIPCDPPSVRVDRLEEAIEIVVGLFRPGPFDFEGVHYRIRALEGLPPPVQQPHPPLFIGGGRPRVLRLAGARAQVVGINAGLRAGELGAHAVADLTPERVAEKVGWAREGAERAGRDPDELVVSINCWLVRVTDDDAAADAFLERMAGRFGITGPELDRSPPVLVGPLERIEAKLRDNRERYGLTHVQLDAGFHPADVEPLLPIVGSLRGEVTTTLHAPSAPDRIGFMTAERFPVEAGHILLFARAIGDPNPIYRDPERAVAPPTFVQASAQFDDDYGLRPKPGQPWMGSAGTPTQRAGGRDESGSGGSKEGGTGLTEQHYTYHRPLRPGDVLTATSRPGETWEKQGRRGGALRFSEQIVEYRDQSGQLVVTARSVGVRTSQVVEQGS